MASVVTAFADELLKLSSPHEGERLSDVVAAEALGPIASAVKGYRHGGALGAARGAGGYVLGGGAGAALGALGAKGLERLTGRDVGVGPFRASTILPALGGLIGGLKAEKLAK